MYKHKQLIKNHMLTTFQTTSKYPCALKHNRMLFALNSLWGDLTGMHVTLRKYQIAFLSRLSQALGREEKGSNGTALTPYPNIVA